MPTQLAHRHRGCMCRDTAYDDHLPCLLHQPLAKSRRLLHSLDGGMCKRWPYCLQDMITHPAHVHTWSLSTATGGITTNRCALESTSFHTTPWAEKHEKMSYIDKYNAPTSCLWPLVNVCPTFRQYSQTGLSARWCLQQPQHTLEGETLVLREGSDFEVAQSQSLHTVKTKLTAR